MKAALIFAAIVIPTFLFVLAFAFFAGSFKTYSSVVVPYCHDADAFGMTGSFAPCHELKRSYDA